MIPLKQKKLFAIFIDIAGLFLSLLFSYMLYRIIKSPAAVRYNLQYYILFSLSASFFMISIFWIKGMYNTRYFLYKVLQVYRIIYNFSIISLVIFIVLFFSKMIIVPRFLLVIMWIGGLSSLLLPRLLFPNVYKLHDRLNILFLQDTGLQRNITDFENRDLRVKYFDNDGRRLKDIRKVLGDEKIDILIINSDNIQKNFLTSIFLYCEKNNVDFFYAVSKPFSDSRMYRLSIWEGLAFLYCGPLSYPLIYRLVKRMTDIIISFALLPVFAISFLYLFAAKGSNPVIKKTVEGHRGRCFDMYLFADTGVSGSKSKLKAAFERLPLVINILKNQMTYTGVTPKNYPAVKKACIGSDSCLKPGIIGMGNIFEDDLMPLFDSKSLDFVYLLNPSVIMDLSIMMFCWTGFFRKLFFKNSKQIRH